MARLGRNVVLLGAASFLADVSGEMLMAVFPFLLLAQGASGLGLGVAGGAADAVGHLVKPVAGAFSDRMRRRKPIIIVGYVTAALARIGIAFSSFWFASAAFRAVDRVGKGLRSSPRDALLAESVHSSQRGRAFGAHRAADTAGAVAGVVLALTFPIPGWSASSVVLAGALIGLTTLAPLAFVREPTPGKQGSSAKFEPPDARYRVFLGVAAFFALGQVSYVFFLVRVANGLGGANVAVALYLLFNVIYLAASYPAGAAGDKWGRPRVLAFGFGLFAAASSLLVMEVTLGMAVLAFVTLGLAFACVDGVERAFAADLAGSVGRSTRLGLYQGTVGVATVAGGIVAGLLWDHYSPPVTFVWGACVSLAALFTLGMLGFLAPRLAASDQA